jgi:thiamine biosynthesis lipoprotein
MIHKTQFRAMGSQIVAGLDSQSRRAAEKLAQVPIWFEEWESALSRFREESELSRINRMAGTEISVSPVFWQVFQLALETESKSGGLVSPLVLDALLHAGYTQSFETLPAITSLEGEAEQIAPVLEESIQTMDEAMIGWDAKSHSIHLAPDVHLDFGGVAKGWAAHQAMRKLEIYGPALVDAGGDIAVSGVQSDGQPWPIGIADPFQDGGQLGLLKAGRCGIATSGTDFRRWKLGKAWQHHIIDPRSGKPAETDVLSATLVAKNVMEAEMAAKVVVILGSQDGLSWLENQPSIEGLLILEDGNKLYSRKFSNYLWEQ